eukprot:2205696-Prymnesium_polylepis.1
MPSTPTWPPQAATSAAGDVWSQARKISGRCLAGPLNQPNNYFSTHHPPTISTPNPQFLITGRRAPPPPPPFHRVLHPSPSRPLPSPSLLPPWPMADGGARGRCRAIRSPA